MYIKGHVEIVDTKDQSNAIVYCVWYLVCRHCRCGDGACNALNAMFVETVDTLVFVALTQHLVQSTMRCENSTLLYIKWPLTLIFNQFPIRKKFWKAETEGFSTIPSILYSQYCRYRTRISNAFNAIYVDTVSILSIQDKDL